MADKVHAKGMQTEDWVPQSLPIPEHWTYAEFEEAFDNLSLTGLKIPQKEYLDEGLFPVVDQGAELIGGYTDTETKVIKLNRSAVIFGDHTKCFKYITFPFAPGADGVKVLVPREPIHEKYAFYACKSLRLPDRGYSRHYSFLKKSKFPLPPVNEQHRIVAKIEALFSELDKGIEALKTAREQLKVYRQAVLKHAFEGKLTAQWREENKDAAQGSANVAGGQEPGATKLESPDQLLARIQQEREARYQQQLEEWKAAVKDWEKNGKEGKKPAKPRKPTGIKQPADSELPSLPEGWLWVEYGGLCEQIRNGISAKPQGNSGTKIFRISAVRAMEFVLNDFRYLENVDGKYDDYFLSFGDLVFTRYNGSRSYVGVCAEYKGDGTHLYPDKLIRTRLGVSSVSSSFLEKAVNCGATRRFVESRIRTTAGQSGVSGSDIKAMPIPVCSVDEQRLIETYVAEKLSEIAAMEFELQSGIKRAETLRQSILKKAFSGQLVPQDPNDEPARVLLARIKAEKTARSPVKGKVKA